MSDASNARTFEPFRSIGKEIGGKASLCKLEHKFEGSLQDQYHWCPATLTVMVGEITSENSNHMSQMWTMSLAPAL